MILRDKYFFSELNTVIMFFLYVYVHDLCEGRTNLVLSTYSPRFSRVTSRSPVTSHTCTYIQAFKTGMLKSGIGKTIASLEFGCKYDDWYKVIY